MAAPPPHATAATLGAVQARYALLVVDKALTARAFLSSAATPVPAAAGLPRAHAGLCSAVAARAARRARRAGLLALARVLPLVRSQAPPARRTARPPAGPARAPRVINPRGGARPGPAVRGARASSASFRGRGLTPPPPARRRRRWARPRCACPAGSGSTARCPAAGSTSQVNQTRGAARPHHTRVTPRRLSCSFELLIRSSRAHTRTFAFRHAQEARDGHPARRRPV